MVNTFSNRLRVLIFALYFALLFPCCASVVSSKYRVHTNGMRNELSRYAERNNGQLPENWPQFWESRLRDYPDKVDQELVRSQVESAIKGKVEDRYQLLTSYDIIDSGRGKLVAVAAFEIDDDRFKEPIRYLIWQNDGSLRTSYLRKAELSSVLDGSGVQLITNDVEVVKLKHIQERFFQDESADPSGSDKEGDSVSGIDLSNGHSALGASEVVETTLEAAPQDILEAEDSLGKAKIMIVISLAGIALVVLWTAMRARRQ